MRWEFRVRFRIGRASSMSASSSEPAISWRAGFDAVAAGGSAGPSRRGLRAPARGPAGTSERRLEARAAAVVCVAGSPKRPLPAGRPRPANPPRRNLQAGRPRSGRASLRAVLRPWPIRAKYQARSRSPPRTRGLARAGRVPAPAPQPAVRPPGPAPTAACQAPFRRWSRASGASSPAVRSADPRRRPRRGRRARTSACRNPCIARACRPRERDRPGPRIRRRSSDRPGASRPPRRGAATPGRRIGGAPF